MANDVSLTDANFYAVIKDRPVELTVEIGDGQVGGTALLLNGAPHAFDPPSGQIGGDGQNLIGSILHATTIVRDINPATNHTSVTYTLRGGVQDAVFPYELDVAADKGSAHYLIAFIFTE